jgi:hypothetical protein
MSWTPDPKTIAPDAVTFTANGKTYHKASSISFQRYGLMEVWNHELGFGRSVEQTFQSERQAFDLLNKLKLAEAAVLLNNSMQGLARIADQGELIKRTHPAIKLSMLFWNHEGEDVRTMPDELMNLKLADMEAEGIDHGFFFRTALANVPGFLSAYRQLTQSGSTETKEAASQTPDPLPQG